MSEQLAQNQEQLPRNTEWDDLKNVEFNDTEAAIETDISQTEQVNNNEHDYFDENGFIKLDKIDISTEEGKYEYMDSLLQNVSQARQDELEEAEANLDDEAIQEAKTQLDYVNRQQRILQDAIGKADGKGLWEELQTRYHESCDRINSLPNEASQKAIDAAFQNMCAANDLSMILGDEMARRDPNYFEKDLIEKELEKDIQNAEVGVESTMLDGIVGKDGHVHKDPNGGKIPSAATEEAKLELADAKNEKIAFDTIWENYQETNNYMAPDKTVKKADFRPMIDNFLKQQTARIDELIEESKSLEKGSAEYQQNLTNRKTLAKMRSAAKRLMQKYFA